MDFDPQTASEEGAEVAVPAASGGASVTAGREAIAARGASAANAASEASGTPDAARAAPRKSRAGLVSGGAWGVRPRRRRMRAPRRRGPVVAATLMTCLPRGQVVVLLP